MALVVVFGSLTVRTLESKHFSVDEFQYAHASWLVAHGQVPYRDFFDDRFPLLYQTLGVIPALRSAKPQDISLLRWAMLPIILLISGLHLLANRRHGIVTALLGITLLLAVPAFTARAVEIRPDALAFALFLAAIVLVDTEEMDGRVAAFVGGLALAASLWTSLKVVYYGSIFAIALLVDRFSRLRREPLLRRDGIFVAGFAAFASVTALYLLLSGSSSDWFMWTVKWAFVHETDYPRVPWITTAAPFLRDSWWVVGFGLVGWIHGLRSTRRETLLLLALPFTFLQFAAQRAPFEYSLIPFIGVVTIYAARGMVFLKGTGRVARVVVIAVGIVGGLMAVVRSQQEALPSSDAQLATLHQLGLATGPDDAVYDNTGAYFARPHAWYFFYTDEVLRRRLYGTLSVAVPQALLRSHAPAVMMDLRFNGLPPDLQQFIRGHYQPYAGDIRLWGMRFGPAQNIDSEFLAIKDGAYFVDPPEVIESGMLIINGRRITSPIFTLPGGMNRVVFDGPPLSKFSILWLPRDGRRYAPAAEPTRSVFSFL